jgi:hypothetical protein
MTEQYINKISVYLTDTQKRQLMSISSDESITLSATIRNLIVKGLKYYQGD